MNASNLFVFGDADGDNWDNAYGSGTGTMQSYQMTLLDGSQKEVVTTEYDQGTNIFEIPVVGAIGRDDTCEQHGLVPSDGTELIYYIDAKQYRRAWDQLIVERDDVHTQLSGFVSDVYSAYDTGEIPTEDIVDPITAATELSQNYDNYATQGVHAAMLGIPTNATQTDQMRVHDPDGDVDLWADVYTNYTPTDADGNEIGFEPGVQYDPSVWAEPLYIAYEHTSSTNPDTTDSTETETASEETAFVQLEDPFTINTIENADGDTVDRFQPESRNNQTADVTAIQEELDQIRELRFE